MTGVHEEKQWLSVIGIGEEGLSELSAPALELISGAEFVIGGHRQLAMIPNSTQKKVP